MEDGEPAYVVEAFRNHRRTKGRYGKLQFLVKWLGYGEHINTWEPADWLQTELDPDSYQSFLSTYTATSGANLDPSYPTLPLPLALSSHSLIPHKMNTTYNKMTVLSQQAEAREGLGLAGLG